MKTILIAFCALISTALAAGNGLPHSSGPVHVAVLAASELAGNQVLDSEGRAVGEIEYLMIDAEQGRVRWAVVKLSGSGDVSDERLVIPWTALRLGNPSNDVARVDRTVESLRNAPRLTVGQLRNLLRPAFASQAAGYYESSSPAGNHSSSSPPASEPHDSSYVLVGGSVPKVLAATRAATAEELLEAEVELADGTEVGTIAEVVLERQTGLVAYIIVARGGFLGFGEEWLPIPLPALQWSAEREDYVLGAPAATLRGLPKLGGEKLPRVVHRPQLAELSQRFGVMPYWERR